MSLESPESVQQHQDKEADSVNNRKNPNEGHANTKSSSSETDSNDCDPATIKEEKLYPFNFNEEERKLVHQVKNNPILYEKVVGPDRDLRAKTWQNVAKKLFGKKYWKKNSNSGI